MRPVKGTGKYKDGSQRYGQFCTTCQKIKYEKRSSLYKRPVLEKTFCSLCGFIPVHTCQLDVDHIDGNRKNNELDNLQIICANCHRLKTFQKKDWL